MFGISDRRILSIGKIFILKNYNGVGEVKIILICVKRCMNKIILCFRIFEGLI